MTAAQATRATRVATEGTLLILGASGDLTSRLLLPGLGGLLATGCLSGVSLIGSALEKWTDEQWRAVVITAFGKGTVDGGEMDRVARGARYIPADVTDAADLRLLLGACVGQPIIYFALPPAITVKACEALTTIGLPAGTRLVMEKPFGTGSSSAAALNELLARLAAEDDTFRVDHFLGRSTVLNILGLRFGNRIIEPLLNASHVQHVDIVLDESLALEGRAVYYDRAGALVDMIQSHALQVLALLAMEAPSTLAAADLRDSKTQLLRATHVWSDDPITRSRRARYGAGEIDGRLLKSYLAEEGVDPARQTETYAEVVFAVDSWRWAGVPFRIRTGKALSATCMEAVITFRKPPWVPTGLAGFDRPDRLRIDLESDRLSLELNISGPGDPLELDPVTLAASFGAGALPAYGEVLKGVLEGDPTLSVRGDAAVQSWRIVEPVLRAWRANQVPMEEYAAGSDGPLPNWPVPGTEATTC